MSVSVDPTTPAGRPRGRPAAVVAVLLVLLVAPVWAVRHFPSQDGPEHAYNATILHDYDRPDAAAFRRYFLISHRPVPNWATHLILDALLSVAPPAVADKGVVSGYLVLFCLAAFYYAGAGPAAGSGGLLLLPFAYNVFLFFGFYNFDYSLPALLLTLGYWRRHAGSFRGRSVAALTVLVTLVYVCHIVTFGIATGVILAAVVQETVGLAATGPLLAASAAVLVVAAAYAFGGPAAAAVVFVLAVVAAVVYARRSPLPIDWPAVRRRLLPAAMPLVAVAPAAALSVAFVAGERGPVRGESAVIRLARLFDWTRTFHPADGAVSVLVMAVLAVATLVFVRAKRRSRTWGRSDALLAAAAGSAAVAFVVPAALSGGSYVVDRVGLLAALLWAAWVVAQLPYDALLPRRGRLVAGGVAVAVTLALVARDAVSMVSTDRAVTEYVAAAAVLPVGASVLPVEYTAVARPRVAFLLHALGWVAADRRAADVTDYEAATGYFPTLFRPDVAFRPPNADNVAPSDYARLTGGRGRPDHVVLWTGGNPPRTAADRRCAADLTADFHEVARSPGRGWCRVYARNGVAVPPTPR